MKTIFDNDHKGGIHIAELKTRKAAERGGKHLAPKEKPKRRINPAIRNAAAAHAKDALAQRREEEGQSPPPAEQAEVAAEYTAARTGYSVRQAARSLAAAKARREARKQKRAASSENPSIHLSASSDDTAEGKPALFHERPEQELKTPQSKAANATSPDLLAGRQAFIQKAKTEKARPTANEAPTLNTSTADCAAIRERPRAEPAMKRKDSSRAAGIKTKASTAEAVKTPAAANAPAQSEAKRAARRHRQGKELAIRQLTQGGNRAGTRTSAAVSRKFTKAAGNAAKVLFTAVMGLGGGAVLIIVLCAVFLVAALVSSPMGILVADEASDGGVTLTSAIAEISGEYSARLRELRSGYDSYTVSGHPPKWKDVIAVYACKVAGSDDGTDVLTLDDEHIEMMKSVFWDMTDIASAASAVYHEDTDPEDDIDDSWTESGIAITVTAKTAEDMRLVYNFSDYQTDTMEALLLELDEWDIFALDLDISDAAAISAWENLPDDLSPERRLVVQYALSLCGKVTYFWGGKSLVLGADPRWGASTLVTAAGSPTTGTYRPYGMDCSGFVDWVFYNASDGGCVIGRGGGVIAQHNNCRSVSWSEAIPGDLVFYPGDSHIGIVVGWDSGGNILICHCASGSQNGVYVTGKVGFTSIARPYYYED